MGSDDVGELEQALEAFLAAFNAMDLEALGGRLAAAVTLFAPDGPTDLVVGRDDVLRHFEKVFGAEPADGPQVRPLEQRLVRLSPESGLTVFTFARRMPSLGRRSLVLPALSS